MSNYVADWLQVVVQLIDGSTEGNPNINGQTLEEEDAREGAEWLDHHGQIIRTHNLSISNADGRLYGGHQFERLLNVFKVSYCTHSPPQEIVNHPTVAKIGMKELADSSCVAINDRMNDYDLSWRVHTMSVTSLILFRPLTLHKSALNNSLYLWWSSSAGVVVTS